MNNYLAKKGLLAVDRSQVKRANIRRRIETAVASVLRPLGFLKFARKTRHAVGTALGRSTGWLSDEMRILPEGIDWRNTRAVVKSSSDCGIFVNLVGREKHGIVAPGAMREEVVEEIIAALKDFINPETGEKIVTTIYRKEEVARGPNMDAAPDIFLHLAHGEIEQITPLGGAVFENSSKTGTHRMEGVFVAAGPGIRHENAGEANIVDVAPAVLHSLGVRIPNGFEGKIPDGLFDENWLSENPIRSADSANEQAGAQERAGAESQEEQRRIEQRLKDLGYL